MIYIIIGILVLAALIIPGWWVKHTLNKYSVEYDALPGTGGELARHLIKRFELPVTLETTDQGDHYDPSSKTVRLSEQYMQGRSLSAVAVATHEVGHAIQHHKGFALLNLRTRLAGLAMQAERVGSMAFVIFPILALISRSPTIGGSLLLLAVGSMFLGVIVHLVTLPVEFDASFNRALPVLEQGEYLNAEEMKIARKILLAAALTYVAGALLSIVNIGRWLYVLRGMR
jgi:Zn-dependent membrane protease YugP